MPRRIATLALVLAVALPGCAGRAWRNAREQDSITAYHRFLRDYPDSSFGAEARARLELARIRKKPTRDSYESFTRKFSDPALAAELLPYVEESYFRHARAVGTVAAYREFLEVFPAGTLARRAEGNLAYVEAGGFGQDVGALADFARRHPESDYAAEARRSVETVDLRSRTHFDRIGLVLEVDPSTPGADRVQRALRDRVAAAYARAGAQVALLESPAQAAGHGLSAVLRIRHRERETATEFEGARLTEPSIVAQTDVLLQRLDEEDPIWVDRFEYRAPLSAGRDDLSILFSPGTQSTYWSDLDGLFFVPIARWSTQRSAREPLRFPKPVVSVEVAGNRAVVLFGDGDFDLLDLGNPAQPTPLGRYDRERDLSTFAGASVAGSRVAVFGPDGIEIVRLDGESTRREAAFGRESVGSVVGVERVERGWIAATNRGLLHLIDGSTDVVTLVGREILGLASAGDRLLFTDGTSLYAASLPMLQAGRVEAELRLGRGFGPRTVRAHGVTAVVLGERDAVWVDLRARQPRLLSRIGGNESGRVSDAAVVGNRLFLLGPRGLQVADGAGERIVDSVDVSARDRLDVAGRHLVLIGDKSMQVVDATPFVASAPAAAGAR